MGFSVDRVPLGLALFFACAAAFAQEITRGIVTIPTRPGVTQSFFVAGMGAVKPQAAALMYAGGHGTIRLRMEGDQPIPDLPIFIVTTSRSITAWMLKKPFAAEIE